MYRIGWSIFCGSGVELHLSATHGKFKGFIVTEIDIDAKMHGKRSCHPTTKTSFSLPFWIGACKS